ncbi:MAG: hypothetical protein KVP17_000168 [Porospora cf. gigantea B]|uniref:uncharacterized protein n=1 Tax=Porospora cf. gigantea B TaxID=2853592 RepID=UPI003571C044|nr:MAG: hypothetical protein KVP17_000168 [Porospora cf. gigantea B]
MEYHEVVPRLDRPTSLVIAGSPPLNPLTSVALRHYQATRGVDVLESFRLWSVAKHLGRRWSRMLFVGIPLSIEKALRIRHDDENQLPTSVLSKRVSVIKRKAVHKKARIAEKT